MLTDRAAIDTGPGAPMPLTERVRDRAVTALVFLIKSGVLHCPRFLFLPLIRALAFLHRHSSRREIQIMRGNLERVLGLPPGSAEMHAMNRRISRHQVASVLETVRGIYRPNAVVIDGMEALRQQVAELEAAGRGQILITAHLGSWELLARCMAEACEARFYSLAKRSPVSAFTEFLEELRHRAGIDVLWIGRKSLLRDMLTALRCGHWLGFVMDQKPEGGRGPRVEFFGQKTEFVAGPASLAIRTGCPVLAAFCVREGPFRYRVWCDRVLDPDHGESNEQALTQRLASEIESAVRRHPEQWPWSYRRWRFDSQEPTTDGRAAQTAT